MGMDAFLDAEKFFKKFSIFLLTIILDCDILLTVKEKPQILKVITEELTYEKMEMLYLRRDR